MVLTVQQQLIIIIVTCTGDAFFSFAVWCMETYTTASRDATRYATPVMLRHAIQLYAMQWHGQKRCSLLSRVGVWFMVYGVWHTGTHGRCTWFSLFLHSCYYYIQTMHACRDYMYTYTQHCFVCPATHLRAHVISAMLCHYIPGICVHAQYASWDTDQTTDNDNEQTWWVNGHTTLYAWIYSRVHTIPSRQMPAHIIVPTTNNCDNLAALPTHTTNY